METRKLSLVYAIVGFIYTTFLFFVFLWLFGIYDLTTYLKGIKEYLPYISIIVFFLAYVIGIISDLILQKFIFKLRNDNFSAETQIRILTYEPNTLRSTIYTSFDKLVILRHFIVGPTLLSISSIIWLSCSNFDNKITLILFVLTSCGLLVVLSFIAYRIRRTIHNQLVEAVNNFLQDGQ